MTSKAAKEKGVTLTPQIIRNASNPNFARQYLPNKNEDIISPDERYDPIGDEAHSPIKGIVHRYPDRALYKITNICAVYCRYCFRKDMIGIGSDHLNTQDHIQALNYLKNTPKIWEVILTGGDPLVLSTDKISQTLDDLEAINHIKIIRIHTRTPLSNPEAITDDLCAALTREKALYITLHINHADELTPEVISAIKKLQQTGAVLLSQSVLLRGVNDNPDTLEQLFRALIELKIKPYYLHHADMATGTSHFRTSIARGQAIMRELQGRLSGIALPTYMLDIPDGHGKIPLTPSYIKELKSGKYHVTDYRGNSHKY